MKRYQVKIPALVLALALSACGAPSPGGGAEADLAAPPALEEAVPEAALEEEVSCAHRPSQGDNTVEHEAAGYCGNTVTTVSRETRMGGEPWEASFWGGDSVALTDLLRYLDYSGGVCRCLPEYNVDTEFGTGYGVNLTDHYARRGDGQADLTEEQVNQIREILERQGATP